MPDDVQTFMLSLRRWSNQPDDAPAEDLMRDAADMLDRLSSRLETAARALERHGYRRSCNIPACNCGDQWNHGGGLICVQPTTTRDRCGMRATHVTPDGKYVCAMHAREIAIVFYSSGGSLEPCKLIAHREDRTDGCERI